jgi:hypothetical protein
MRRLRDAAEQCPKIDLAGKYSSEHHRAGAKAEMRAARESPVQQIPNLDRAARGKNADIYPPPAIAMLPREEERNGKQKNAERPIQAAERNSTEIQ